MNQFLLYIYIYIYIYSYIYIHIYIRACKIYEKWTLSTGIFTAIQ